MLSLLGEDVIVKKGAPGPVVDAVIAVVAMNRELTLVTRNKHFEWIKEEFEGLKLLER